MNDILNSYLQITGKDKIEQLQQIAALLKGIKIVHINSTKIGGGVAEVLTAMIPLTNALGIPAQWETVEGDNEYYQCTKSFHNSLQGIHIPISETLLKHYEKTNEANAERLHQIISDADLVVIHDPQPVSLIEHFPKRKGKWVWRCHVDVSHPYRPTWKYLEQFVAKYDAVIFSLADFVVPLTQPMYLIPPSIDPLSEKNRELSKKEIQSVYETFGIDSSRPMILQVSRYDRFKDPVGVIEAYRLAKKFHESVQLVLAGGGASDDPESEAILQDVKLAKRDDPDIHILFLPADAHLTINALQRAADIVLQKSLKEGFGLTVTEALWKGKPVIGGNVGGIRLQVIDYHTGFLVNTPEGAANRIRYLLHHKHKITKMGETGREFVREKFLITRHLREYLTLFVSLFSLNTDRIELHRPEQTYT